MKRPLFALALGALVGACVGYATSPGAVQPPQPVAGWDAVRTGAHCWSTDKPFPAEFGGMKVTAASAQARRIILERNGRSVLLGELIPGLVCVLAYGAEA